MDFFCVHTPVLFKYFQCDCITGIVELVKKFGNSSFEREDEEVNIVLNFGWFIKAPKDGISANYFAQPKITAGKNSFQFVGCTDSCLCFL